MKIRGNELLLIYVLAMSSFRTPISLLYLITLKYVVDELTWYLVALVVTFCILMIGIDYRLIAAYKFCINRMKQIDSIYVSNDYIGTNLIVMLVPLAALIVSIMYSGVGILDITSAIVLFLFCMFNVTCYFKISKLKHAYARDKCAIGTDIVIEYKIGRGVIYGQH